MMPDQVRSGWNNSQILLCCWFRRTSKAMKQVYQCWKRIFSRRKKTDFFQVRLAYVSGFIFICGVCTDSPSYEKELRCLICRSRIETELTAFSNAEHGMVF
jgi:uncharacterized CHY-type Zn-finger protein